VRGAQRKAVEREPEAGPDALIVLAALSPMPKLVGVHRWIGRTEIELHSIVQYRYLRRLFRGEDPGLETQQKEVSGNEYNLSGCFVPVHRCLPRHNA
jgi:hypothetical protein